MMIEDKNGLGTITAQSDIKSYILANLKMINADKIIWTIQLLIITIEVIASGLSQWALLNSKESLGARAIVQWIEYLSCM